MSSDPAAALLALTGVGAGVDAARQACERLRWHPAMRRRSAQVRVEAGVWQAWASAALDGARLPIDVVRAAGVGARPLPSDPVGAVVEGALRAGAQADQLTAAGGRLLRESPRQALARLHLAAAGGISDEADLGRPRADPAANQRLTGLIELLARPSQAPALVVAALAQAELTLAQPFTGGNAVVGRALARAIVIGRGLDPMGAAVPDVAMLTDQQAYHTALEAYSDGGTDGVAHWLRYYADCVVAGAEHGGRLGDSVLAGRPLSPG